MKIILKNILKAVAIICYFSILAYASIKMDKARLVEDIKVFSGIFLVFGIIVLEKAYKKDNGKLAITAIELLILSFYSLSIMHMIDLLKYDFKTSILISAIVASSYYIIKGIIIYTRERKDVLENLSDIADIVKEDKPVKKEARKRSKKHDEIKKNTNGNLLEENKKGKKVTVDEAKKEQKEKSSKVNKETPEDSTEDKKEIEEKIKDSKKTNKSKNNNKKVKEKAKKKKGPKRMKK